MRIGERTFGGRAINHIEGACGLFGVSWIVRTWAGIRPVDTALAPVHGAFLRAVDSMVAHLPDGERYIYGTTYYRVMPADQPATAGTWHYDTGLNEPSEVRNAGAPVLRFTGMLSSGPERVANLFTRDAAAVGRSCAEVMPADVAQPGNGEVAMFSEGFDLHARPARDAAPGGVVAFFSAALYIPVQTPNLSCSALEALR